MTAPTACAAARNEARARLRQLADVGFDDAVLVVDDMSEANLEAVRALWPG